MTMYKELVLLLLCLVAPSYVQSCSCVEGSFRVKRSETIRSSFCSEYSSADVYAGEVIGATCNCIPGNEEVSSRLNCQQYQLDQGTASAAILAVGQCQFEQYAEYSFASNCSNFGNSLGVSVEIPEFNGEETNLTHENLMYCEYACNSSFEEYSQPCEYTVRITEVFKGNYSRDQVIEAYGPDVTSSCGYYGRVLQLGTIYVAGVGGACSPIGEWTALSEYSQEEVELMRGLSEVLDECVSSANAVVASMTLIIMLAVAVSAS